MIKEKLERMIDWWITTHPGQTREQAISNIKHRADTGMSFDDFKEAFMDTNDKIENLISALQKLKPEMSYAEALNSVQVDHPALFSEPDGTTIDRKELETQISDLITRKMETTGLSYAEALNQVSVESPLPFACLDALPT